MFGTDRRNAIFAVLAMAVLLGGAPLAAEPPAVRVGVFPAAPMVSVAGGKPEGFFIDILERIAADSGWKLEYVPGTWAEQLSRLEKGEIDLLPAVGFTEGRKRVYDFSKDPVFIDSGVIFKNPGSRIRSIYDLKGDRVAALRGSAFTAGFEDYMASLGVAVDLVRTGTNEEVMELVQSGRASAGVCIYSLGRDLMKKYRVDITPITFAPLALHFAVPAGKSAAILERIDLELAAAKGSPGSFLDAAAAKWLGESKEGLPGWVLFGLATAVLAGVAFAGAALFLRREVARRTAALRAEVMRTLEAEEGLRRTVAEKDVLLREVHHRTKNSMQVVRSMLRIQASDFPESAEVAKIVEDTDERIQAISLVYELLYGSKDLSEIGLDAYLGELTALLSRSHRAEGRAIAIRLEAPPASLSIDVAVPLGLAVNELFTNSVKHAFAGVPTPTVSIGAQVLDNGRLRIVFADNGRGAADPAAIGTGHSLGSVLIRSVIESQLGGSIRYENDGGLKCVIEVPVAGHGRRI